MYRERGSSLPNASTTERLRGRMILHGGCVVIPRENQNERNITTDIIRASVSIDTDKVYIRFIGYNIFE